MTYEYKPIVAFDFDGVIHSYTSGWKGHTATPDPPVKGIKQAIDALRKRGYSVVVTSSRALCPEGKEAIKLYLDQYGIEVDEIRSDKPPAFVYIDDRAICFDGDAKALLAKVENFKPWNYKEKQK